MSPSIFNNNFVANEFNVNSTGELNEWGNTWNGYGVRPVINIDPSQVTFTGSGTMQDPYVIA